MTLAVPSVFLLVFLVPALACAADAGGGPERAVVGIQSWPYVDEARRNWQNTGPRPLATVIWYPATPRSPVRNLFSGPKDRKLFAPSLVSPGAKVVSPGVRRPLVVISHGTGGSAAMMMWLGRYLAARGYIAAAVNHHGNTGYQDKYTPQGFRLIWERPRDLSVLIDRLLEDPVFGPLIDRDRIGAAGFSLGGYTVIAVAGGRLNRQERARFCASAERDFTCGPQPEFPDAQAQMAKLAKTDPIVQESMRHAADSYRDERIKAIFAIAPVLGGGFTRKDLQDVRVPVRIVVGAKDPIAQPPTNAQHFAELIPQAKLTLLPRGVSPKNRSHLSAPRARPAPGPRRDRRAAAAVPALHAAAAPDSAAAGATSARSCAHSWGNPGNPGQRPASPCVRVTARALL